MSIPPPPPRADLADFPALLWSRLLYRIVKLRNPDGSERLPLFFSTAGEGRFDLAPLGSATGTCYLGADELACVVEVFGRLRTIPPGLLQDYRIAIFSSSAELRLADTCEPVVLGQFGLTRELCTTPDYERTQQWARAWLDVGFAGIHYAPRHDPRGDLRAIALFGRAGPQGPPDVRLQLESMEPLGDACLRRAARYGLYVADAPPLGQRSREG